MQIHHITFEPVFTGFMGKWLVLNGKKHWGCLFQGGGSALGPQLIAELGDVTRFSHRDANHCPRLYFHVKETYIR